MSSYSEKEIIEITKTWISKFVIKHGLCPFAHIPFDNKSIVYQFSTGDNFEKCIVDCWGLLQSLEKNNDQSDGFLICPSIGGFENLLDLKNIVDELLDETHLADTFQTVGFHPEFIFEGEASDHAGNFVNRSPFAMVHILRREEVAKAVASLDDPATVPAANQIKLEKIGYATLASFLESIKTSDLD